MSNHTPAFTALINVCLDAYMYDEVRVEAVMAAATAARNNADAHTIHAAAQTVKREWATPSHSSSHDRYLGGRDNE
jgi:hypothetical protein